MIDSGKYISFKEEEIVFLNETRTIRTSKIPIKDHTGEAKYLLSVSEDVTEFNQAKVELEKLSQRLTLATNAAQIGVWDWNLETNELHWDNWMFKIFDVDPMSFTGELNDFTSCLHPEDVTKTLEAVEDAAFKKNDLHLQFRIIHKNGDIKYIRADGKVYGDRMIGINVDISEVVVAQQKIYKMAQTDNLTGLANRNALNKFVTREFARCKRENKLLACLYFDLNDFKPINDSFGHKVGDELLVEVATRLSNKCRATDLVARIGGDEFVVIISELESEQYIKFTQKRYLDSLASSFESSAGPITIKASLGFAIFPSEATTLDDLLHIADKRMYADKQRLKSNDGQNNRGSNPLNKNDKMNVAK